MTIKTWKKEFYPKSAGSRMTKVQAIRHSLKKWRGLTKENLKKHDLHIDKLCGSSITDSEEVDAVKIDSRTCALCAKYADRGCLECPLYKHLGKVTCDAYGQPYKEWYETYRALPMIKALEATLEEAENEQ